MKAIRVHEFGGPEALILEEVAEPVARSQEVVVRVKAVGVNPYDTYMRAGTYGVRNPKLPFTPGSDAAGLIESIGPGVDNVTVGTRVFTSGTISGAYAELALCKASQVHPLPEQATFVQGAGVFVPYATAYRALFQLANAKPAETILIHGASGGVGTAAVQWARAAGMKIIGTAGSEKGLELVRAQGADHAFDHRTQNYPDEIFLVTRETGVDVLLELAAHINLAKDLKMMARRGRIIVIGSRGDIQITPRDLMSRQSSVTGMILWDTPEEEMISIHAVLQEGLRSGILRPIVGKELPLEQAAEAHRLVTQPGALGKIILRP